MVAQALKASHDLRQAVQVKPLLENEDYDNGIVGRSEAMQSVFKLVGQLAASDATALITGESGTGKELVAHSIFLHSKRNQKPFLAINCAAIPENLLESELFGHEKGAFTGATNQRIGRFEQCHGGTLFLDEIGDMAAQTQTKILRVLQNGTFERVGGNTPIQVDVRIIAATNRPLEESVAKREFREDLFYRLNVFRIHLPPLRDRPEDIRLLVDYFLRKLGTSGATKSISPEALAHLEAYRWPGNVRELENVLRRAVVLAKGPVILPQDLPLEIFQSNGPTTAPPATASTPPVTSHPQPSESSPSVPAIEGTSSASDLARALFRWARQAPHRRVIDAVERELVIEALKETSGNQVQAAKILGITRATLRKRIERFGIRQELSIQ
jgi:two-component system nitrogen regulation response regulator GlnG